ncbi:MAG TPA: hypothetical protein VNA57_10375 [Acidimicrobiales bacterium]|nr:hypothetical protein [Acidimicrobiales bacterium]
MFWSSSVSNASLPQRPPHFLPMLAGGNGIPTDPAAYQLEPKFDGQRIILTVADGLVGLNNRAGRDATAVYPELSGVGASLGGRPVVLDGEVVAPDDQGSHSFQRLQRRMHVARPAARLLSEVPVVFFAFDVLWLDGQLLTGLPQHERRQVLRSLELRGPAWQTAPVVDATPEELVAACNDLGLEGFMAKRLDASYLPGRRSPAWRKIKCGRRRELIVGGWSPGKGSRTSSIGSLAVGCYDVAPETAAGRGEPARLIYAGQVGSGLTEDMIGALRDLFAKTAIASSPFATTRLPPGLSFVQPLLVVEVAYSEVTDMGTLRQPSFKGLRTDLDPMTVVADEEIATRSCPPTSSPAW